MSHQAPAAARPHLLIFRDADPGVYARMTPELRTELAQQWGAWVDDLMARGKMVSGHPLELGGCVISGKTGERVTDGPYAEAKEAVAGYLFLTVKDFAEAQAIARHCPSLPHGISVEVRPVEEFIEQFELTDVNASPAFFDVRKLTHVNGEYIRALSVDEFCERAAPFCDGGADELAALASIAPLVQERVKTLAEVAPMIEFLWREPEVDEADWDKHVTRGAAGRPMLVETRERLGALPDDGWVASAIETAVLDATVALGFVNDEGRPRLAKTQGPVRVATTGRAVGPPLWESLEQLGRERTLARLDAALARAA